MTGPQEYCIAITSDKFVGEKNNKKIKCTVK
jgi:hypothetical protein